MGNTILSNVLTPMNHREIDFYAKKLSDCAIPAVFSCSELLEWLDKTGERLFDEDLVMDYGRDCLRLYLLFEKTPKENDAPYYDSWNEGALEGIYKFLSRYHRMVLASVEWSHRGNYSGVILNKDYLSMQTLIESAKQKVNDCIVNGNTATNRHRIVSILMELQKVLQKELKINEIITTLQTHAIETAVPGGGRESHLDAVPFQESNQQQEESIIQICQSYVTIVAPFCPNISKILWSTCLERVSE